MKMFGVRRAARMMALGLSLAAAAPAAAQVPGETVVYRGAQVWTGRGFALRDLAVRDGRFVAPPRAGMPARIERLAGHYVVPPYANAHAHVTPATPAGSARFLNHGVFYVWNPNTIVQGPEARAFFARPDTYDVAVAQGGISEPGGHPEGIYVRILGPQVYSGRTLESFIGDAFHYGRTPQEIDAALDLLVRQGAEFVKSYLLHSEDYAARLGNEAYYGLRGINPANASHLVAAARRRGLRTAFHIETVSDLVTAAESGAGMVAHLPGYSSVDRSEDLAARRITATAARRVVRGGMLLVPTYSLAVAGRGERTPEQVRLAAELRTVQASNLRMLARAGGIFLIGTDQWDEIFSETEHLASLRVFRPSALLQILFRTGPLLFPARRIGCFDAGCEADFLVLRENPLDDIRALRSIETRIKAGRTVTIPQEGAVQGPQPLNPPDQP